MTSFLLYQNQLTGSISSTMLGAMTALQFLDIRSNQLAGSIPTEIGTLLSLQDVLFDSNQMVGRMPSEFGRLTLLRECFLQDNLLTGSVPTELGLLTDVLQFLYLYTNQLIGSIPAALCNANESHPELIVVKSPARAV
eukprot:CAMPEP_0116867202 /NCGR_PEP_ID=MMETSP0418-20121206/26483_1 /TAXON_ID=1158023 /ORGANISM="Astrosyne radiata, Strain 13vi08-1A" /LENGTH=137 /DNA_ID=CAMNT_0004502981 /DNA_START=104 /DNA_END=518 /DNA_ORIENTATION=+